MTLGLPVGKLRMGLRVSPRSEWVQPAPDLVLRNAAFDADANAVHLACNADAPGQKRAFMPVACGRVDGRAGSHMRLGTWARLVPTQRNEAA